MDLGLVRDSREELRGAMLRSLETCDVVVTSGGVSMGSADYMKSILEEVGKVIFGRLNMKPGKPTTFATVDFHGSRRLIFALPGNPVSCNVTAWLLINPALKRLGGAPLAECYHPQVDAALASDFKLDPERPEYHRARVEWDAEGRLFVATSTGPQQSSRLLSLVGSNAFICVPKGSGTLKRGTVLPVLLSGEIFPPQPEACFHTSTGKSRASPQKMLRVASHPLHKEDNRSSKSTKECATCILSVVRSHESASSGSLAASHLIVKSPEFGSTISLLEMTTLVEPTAEEVGAAVKRWTMSFRPPQLVLVFGGCGLGAHEPVPTALEEAITKPAPLISHLLLESASVSAPHLAATQRTSAGICNERTFLASLPSWDSSVPHALDKLMPLLPRIVQTLRA